MTTSLPATPARAVDDAIRTLLPGAVSSVRSVGQGTGDELVFRVGPRNSVVLRAEAAGWTVAPAAHELPAGTAGEETAPGHTSPTGAAPLALGAASEAPAGAVAAAFVGFLRAWSTTAVAGEFDPGLAAALNPATAGAGPSLAGYSAPAGAVGGILPPFAPNPGARGSSFAAAAAAPTRTSFTRRAIVIASIIVGSLLVLGGGAAGVSAVIAASVKAGQDASGSDGAEGTTSVKKLSVGDCFDVADASDTSGKVEPLACSKSHDSEVFAVVTIPETTDKSGRMQYDLADIACFGHYSSYVGTSYNNSNDDYDVLTPSESAWKAGDRQAYCYLTFDDDRTGSARGSGE